MPSVDINKESNFEWALRRFKRICEKVGIPGRCRDIERYVKPTTQRKRDKAAAVKRWHKKLAKDAEIRRKQRGRY